MAANRKWGETDNETAQPSRLTSCRYSLRPPPADSESRLAVKLLVAQALWTTLEEVLRHSHNPSNTF